MCELLDEVLALFEGEPAPLPAAHTKPWPGLQRPWGWGADSIRSSHPAESCADCSNPFRGNDGVHVMPDGLGVHTACAKRRLEAHGWVLPENGPPVPPPGLPAGLGPSLVHPDPPEPT